MCISADAGSYLLNNYKNNNNNIHSDPSPNNSNNNNFPSKSFSNLLWALTKLSLLLSDPSPGAVNLSSAGAKPYERDVRSHLKAYGELLARVVCISVSFSLYIYLVCIRIIFVSLMSSDIYVYIYAIYKARSSLSFSLSIYIYN